MSAAAGTVPVKDFFTLDLRSLALFRVGLGVMVLIDWVDRLPDLAAHYSDAGVVPRAAVGGIQPLSVHAYSGEVWLQAVLAFAALAAGVALVVGWRTPLACLISWFLLVSVHARNPAVLQGGDQLLRMLAFWGVFLPIGARYSFDSVRPGSGPPSDRVLGVASFAYVVQIVVVYFFAAIWKWSPEWRETGTAVYEALEVSPFATRVGQLLLHWPEALNWLTHATTWLEMLGPVLLFLPFNVGVQRLIAVSLFVLFHLGLALTLELGNFPYVCMVAWVALLPSSLWDRMAAALRPAGEGLAVVYDPQAAAARDVTAGFLSWLFLYQAKHESADASLALGLRKQGGWAVLQGGKQLAGVEALAALVAASPVYSRLAPLCRTRLGSWLAALPAQPPWRLGLILRAGVGLLAAALMTPAFPAAGWVLLPILILGVAALILEGGAEHLAAQAAGPGPAEQPQAPRPTRPSWAPPGGPAVSAVLAVLILYVVLFNTRNYGSYRVQFFKETARQQASERTREQEEAYQKRMKELEEEERQWNAVLPYGNLAFGPALGIDQGWGLFAPRPGRVAGWYFIVGVRTDGSRIDLLDGGKPVDDFSPDSKPAVPSASYPNGRWRKIIMYTSAFDHSDPSKEAWETHNFRYLLPNFCQYFYRDWNGRHEGAEKVVAVEIVYWKEETRPPGEKPPPPLRMPLVYYDHVGRRERFVYYPKPFPARPGQP